MPRYVEGYAIVSEDGMLADADGVMPDSLKFEADARFFEQGLDAADVVVHGRHSGEQQARSPLRRRLILTRSVSTLAVDTTNPRAMLWNPAGATFDEALQALGMPDTSVGVIGGTEVFGLLLDVMDVFHLTRAPNVWLPGGRPVFPGVPARSPEAILAAHGFQPGQRRLLDPAKNLALVSWSRNAHR